MLIALCRNAAPGPQDGPARPSPLWLGLAALLVLGWALNRSTLARHAPQSVHAGHASIRAEPPRPAMHPHFRHALQTRSDLSSLIATARETASSGGHYRALRALDFCARQARNMLEDRHDDQVETGVFSDPRQALALMQIRALCARDAETAALDYYALTEEGLERPDPVLSLAMRLERLSAAPHESADLQDAAQRRDLITRIFAVEEPALLGDLANELSLLGPRIKFTVAGVEVEPEAQPALLAALRDLACGSVGCADRDTRVHEQLLRCAASAQCDPATDSAPASWQRMRFVALLQFSGGRALDFSYRPTA